MIVITMTDCPNGLRGDLTKWMLEVSPGVFVGQVSSRVRDGLWERIKETSKNGRVTMVFSTNNEQRLDFRIHNSTWEPIDYDGIKLMLRPSPSRVKQLSNLRMGFSNASKRQAAKRAAQKKRTPLPDTYVVIDLETSGLYPDEDVIIELGALLVEEHSVKARYSTLIRPEKPIAPQIEALTGITNEMLEREGVEMHAAMEQFMAFLNDLPIVAHNANFDYNFLCAACAVCDLPTPYNRCIDTLTLAKRKILQIKNYRLSTLAEHFGFEPSQSHRSLADCETTYQLYEKLINLEVSE